MCANCSPFPWVRRDRTHIMFFICSIHHVRLPMIASVIRVAYSGRARSGAGALSYRPTELCQRGNCASVSRVNARCTMYVYCSCCSVDVVTLQSDFGDLAYSRSSSRPQRSLCVDACCPTACVPSWHCLSIHQCCLCAVWRCSRPAEVAHSVAYPPVADVLRLPLTNTAGACGWASVGRQVHTRVGNVHGQSHC